jgi:hypothetical protein
MQSGIWYATHMPKVICFWHKIVLFEAEEWKEGGGGGGGVNGETREMA